MEWSANLVTTLTQTSRRPREFCAGKVRNGTRTRNKISSRKTYPGNPVYVRKYRPPRSGPPESTCGVRGPWLEFQRRRTREHKCSFWSSSGPTTRHGGRESGKGRHPWVPPNRMSHCTTTVGRSEKGSRTLSEPHTHDPVTPGVRPLI